MVRRLVPLESEEQMALMQWIALQPGLRDYVLSIPNEGIRTARMGRRLRLMGLLKGAPDLFIALPRSSYHGLFLELKRREKSKVQPEQIAFAERMTKVGYYCAICYGWDEAKAVIQNYLGADGGCNGR